MAAYQVHTFGWIEAAEGRAQHQSRPQNHKERVMIIVTGYLQCMSSMTKTTPDLDSFMTWSWPW
jgi:hypothetical protein